MDPQHLLERWRLRPNKALGQHFLADEVIAARIADAAELTSDDTVLEIGAGLGILTQQLAQRAGHVVAVELDARLASILGTLFADQPHVRIVQGDFLALDPVSLVGGAERKYKVVANLPYYITSAVLRHLLEAAVRPERMVLTVQREVAEAIIARPGEMSLLAVSVQFYGRPRLLFRIKPGSFYPPPEVESAVLRIDTYPAPPVAVDDVQFFFRVVRAGFSQRRKQLRNSLAAGLGCTSQEVVAALLEAGVDPRRRAETLSLEEWARVAQAFRGEAVPPSGSRLFPS